MPMLIAAIRSIATYIAVSLYVFLVGPPMLLVAVVSGRVRPLYLTTRGAASRHVLQATPRRA